MLEIILTDNMGVLRQSTSGLLCIIAWVSQAPRQKFNILFYLS